MEVFTPTIKLTIKLVKKDGPIDLDVFEKNWYAAAVNVLKKHADTIYNKFVDTIKSKPILSWPPLSIPYLAYKKRKGYSEKIYIAKGELLDDLQVRMTGDARGGKSGKENPLTITVGPSNGTHSRAKMKYEKLWRILEYGAFTGKGYIPPRPIWRPLIYEYSKLIKRYSKEMSEGINKELTKAGKQGGKSGASVRVTMNIQGVQKNVSSRR